MIIVLRKGTTKEQIKDVVRRIEADGLEAKLQKGKIKTVINVIGNTAEKSIEPYEALPYVEVVFRVQEKKYRGISRENGEPHNLVIVSGVRIGSDKLTLMLGPCALEGKEQIVDSVKLITDLRDNHSGENIEGVIIRGGAYKPRTSPDTYQGMGADGLKLFSEIAHSRGLPIATEVLDTRDVEFVAQHTDLLWVGARNSQNYPLLKEVGKAGKPVMLKRAMGGSIEELMGSANYIIKHGNEHVILCLRGIKGPQDNVYRNSVDIADIPYLKAKARVPVIFDPSHSTGKRDFVIAVSKQAVVGGVDGLLVDVHPYPESAIVDAAQQLNPTIAAEFMYLMNHYKGAYRLEQKTRI